MLWGNRFKSANNVGSWGRSGQLERVVAVILCVGDSYDKSLSTSRCPVGR